jgi:hypothetical protein
VVKISNYAQSLLHFEMESFILNFDGLTMLKEDGLPDMKALQGLANLYRILMEIETQRIAKATRNKMQRK